MLPIGPNAATGARHSLCVDQAIRWQVTACGFPSDSRSVTNFQLRDLLIQKPAISKWSYTPQVLRGVNVETRLSLSPEKSVVFLAA